MLTWLKRKASPRATSFARPPRSVWSAEDIPRYPPFMKGLPAVPPEQLLETQRELLERIANTAIATPEIIERHYLPAIQRFASFAHLLPASQSHHHRGAGGLLRHSLEVGLWALQSADRVLLDAAKTPSRRREMEPRWQLAVFLAALCHDAGKPVTDLSVTDRDRAAIWKPIKEDLYAWAARNEIDAYFLEWREGRSRQHTALANLIADRIIGTDTLQWIEEGGTELIVWLMEALTGNPGPANLIHDLVIKADQTSVERDLRTLGVAMAGYELGVPVERHLTDIMRRYVKEGVWLVNEPGARVWNIGGNIYLVWPAAGEEIARQVREDGIPGIPRTPDGILDMLVERQIAFVREGAEPGDRFWKIAPAVLAEKIPGIKLQAIRVKDEALLSSNPIPSVEGEIINEPESCQRQDGSLTHMEMAGQPGNGQPPGEQISRSAPGHREPTVGEASVSSVAKNAQTSAQSRVAALTPALKNEGKKSRPALCERDSGRTEQSITLDGAVGEALKALAQDLKAGDKRWGVDAALDSDHLLLRWPDAFKGYGLTPKTILDELSVREWLWLDPMAPLKKVLDADMGGQPVKAIRLERDISRELIQLAGGVARCKAAPNGVQPPAEAGESASEPDHAAGETRRSGGAGRVQGPEQRPRGAAIGAGGALRSEFPAAKDTSTPDADADGERDCRGAASPELRSSPMPSEAQVTAVSLPSLEDFLAVLMDIPGAAQPDGWRQVSKSEAMEACKSHGVRMTHSRLAKLAEADTTRLMLVEGMVRYRMTSS